MVRSQQNGKGAQSGTFHVQPPPKVGFSLPQWPEDSPGRAKSELSENEEHPPGNQQWPHPVWCQDWTKTTPASSEVLSPGKKQLSAAGFHFLWGGWSHSLWHFLAILKYMMYCSGVDILNIWDYRKPMNTIFSQDGKTARRERVKMSKQVGCCPLGEAIEMEMETYSGK